MSKKLARPARSPGKKGSPFDAAYYERFYESRITRVYGEEEIAHLARGVVEMIRWYGGALGSALDVGAGVGIWRDWFRAHEPEVAYRSIEVSPFACEKYGHEHRDIARWSARERYDLVICHGVLPYIDDEGAAKAIANIGKMASGFLYLEAITKADLRDVVDPDATDVAVHFRSGAWYRKHLDPHFHKIGAGLYYAKRGPLVFYELERG